MRHGPATTPVNQPVDNWSATTHGGMALGGNVGGGRQGLPSMVEYADGGKYGEVLDPVLPYVAFSCASVVL
jgi:hypothetical protein